MIGEVESGKIGRAAPRNMNKAYILQEIKRTAEANGGSPLGSRRFQYETGIKQSDWYGVYWARWSDAQREAGFAANRLNAAYDKTEVLGKYARLTQELGRLPTYGDLRLKRQRNSDFPDWKVFNRFGNKSELITQLIEYCRNRAGYEDIIPLCEGYAPHGREVPHHDGAQEEEIGFVYLIKSSRFYKIGRTNAVGRREYELKIQLPERAMLIHSIRTDDPSGIEAYWHKRYEAKRRNGEWFELTAADIAAFKRRKFM